MAATATNPNDPDAIMLAQVDYWKTHKATTTAQAQQKAQAYAYANDHGIKGAQWLDYNELKLEPNSQTSLNTKNLGAGLSVLATGAAGLAGGPAAGVVAGAAAAPIIAGSEAQHMDFGGAPTAPAASYLRGGGSLSDPAMPGSSLSDPAMPAGYGAGGGGQPAVTKGDPSNGAWDAFVPAGGIPATGGGTMATPAYAPQSGSTGNPYLDMVLHNAQTTQATNQGIVNDQVLPAIKQQRDVTSQVGQNLGANLTAENGMIGNYQTGNNGLIQQGYDASGAFIGQNDAALGQYQATMGGFSQLAATPYQGDYTSNAGDVARQQDNYNSLAGVGNGSLNYSAAQAGLSQASLAQAQLTQAGYQTAGEYQDALTQQAALQLAKYQTAASNAGDVQGERDALGQLTGIAGGSLDVKNGANSPEAYQAQLSALAQMKDLTNPQKTSQEEFLYEQQRQREEQDQSANRAAVMQNLRQRGMSGSGMQLTNQLGSDQITSQNRLLGDLGTQATAVARASANLGNYGNLSSTMVGQGNQVGESNAAIRSGAAGSQGQLAATIRGQGDTLNMFNANAYNANEYQNAQMTNNQNQFNADSYNHAQIVNATNRMNNNQFNAQAYNSNQQFNAGSANDISRFNASESNSQSRFNAGEANQTSQFNAGQTNMASANNQSTQLGGMQAAGNQAASMRNASDAVGLANSAQQGISNRANDIFAAQQQTDAAARAKTLVDTTQGTATTDLNSKTNAINAASLLGDKSLAAGFKGTDDTASYWKTLADMGQTNTNNALAFGGLSTGVNTQGQQTLSSALLPAAGNATANGALQLLGKSPYTYA